MLVRALGQAATASAHHCVRQDKEDGCNRACEHASARSSRRLIRDIHPLPESMPALRILTIAMALGAAEAAAAAPADLCESDEAVRFACTMARSGKTVSICDGPRHLVYRFGKPGSIELSLPDPKAPSAPHLVHERFGSSESKGVAFPRGAHTYVVMHFLGGRPVVEELAISVQRNGSPTALLKCALRPAPVGDLPALFERLRAAGTRVVDTGSR